MITENDVSLLVDRIAGMWPVMKNNEEQKRAIAMLIMERGSRLNVEDLNEGYRLLVLNGKTSRPDGGPAFPPAPGEILGCILASASARRTTPRDGSPRKVAGRVCRKCGSAVHYLPGEETIHCGSCNTVQMIAGKTQLSPHDVHSLRLEDPDSYSDEEVEAAKRRFKIAMGGM